MTLGQGQHVDVRLGGEDERSSRRRNPARRRRPPPPKSCFSCLASFSSTFVGAAQRSSAREIRLPEDTGTDDIKVQVEDERVLVISDERRR